MLSYCGQGTASPGGMGPSFTPELRRRMRKAGSRRHSQAGRDEAAVDKALGQR